MSLCCLPFNSDFYVMYEVKYLIDQVNIKYGIETGTYKGSTSLFLSQVLSKVYTVEINDNYFNEAKNNFEKLKLNNIHQYKGSSDKVFETLLPIVKKELDENKEKYVLFYLDAHWNDYWPLLDELDLISKYFSDRAIIIIDDIQVPNKPFGFDYYKNQPNNFDFVKDKVEKVYPSGYTYWYNSKCLLLSHTATAGKLYIVPKEVNINWIDGHYSKL
jgi:predicted O-methyltransferase YrrM